MSIDAPLSLPCFLALALVACGSTQGISPLHDGGGSAPGTSNQTDAGPAPPVDAAGEGGTPNTPSDAGPAGDTGSGGDAAVASRKRGLAYGSNTDADLTALSAGIGWWYNWSTRPDKTLSSNYAATGVEYVPMIWGGTFDPNQVAAQIPADARYLLAFNEPNFGAQSNLTPQQAAALWPKVEQVAKARGLKIVSPALNYCGGNCNETNPFTWLDAFFAACPSCQVDYVGLHWYACSKSALTGYLSEYETKYKQPLWLTEFSCLDGSIAATDANEAKYMAEAIAVLESDPRVFRYSWFTGRQSNPTSISVLAPASGSLTPLGQEYVTLP